MARKTVAAPAALAPSEHLQRAIALVDGITGLADINCDSSAYQLASAAIDHLRALPDLDAPAVRDEPVAETREEGEDERALRPPTGRSTDSRPFRTGQDIAHLVDTDESSALLFNPAASDNALLCAALARAENAAAMLNAWATVGEVDADVSAVAGSIRPIADEVVSLLAELSERFRSAS